MSLLDLNAFRIDANDGFLEKGEVLLVVIEDWEE